jgi:hypothetical protein
MINQPALLEINYKMATKGGGNYHLVKKSASLGLSSVCFLGCFRSYEKFGLLPQKKLLEGRPGLDPLPPISSGIQCIKPEPGSTTPMVQVRNKPAKQWWECIGPSNISQYTSGKWFGRFMKGAHMMTGMIRKQNQALTSALVMAVCVVAEARWHLPIGDELREELEDSVCFMLAAFRVGLGGEEVPLISMEGLLTFWDESRMEEDSHVMLTLNGCFKGEVDERWNLVPVSDFLRSGFPFRLWMERALHRRVNLHNRDIGWLFQNRRGVRTKCGRYDALFRVLIDQAWERHPLLLPETVDTSDFSFWRSPRQGAVLETTNQDVAEKVIKLVNRWRKKEAAKGSEAGLPMRQVYMQVRSTLPTMQKFSKAL